MNLNIQVSDLINMYTLFFDEYWPIMAIACALLLAPRIINIAKDAIEDRRYKKYARNPFRVRTGTMSYYWNNKVGSHVVLRGTGRHRIKR
jgi:hypothetical protein